MIKIGLMAIVLFLIGWSMAWVAMPSMRRWIGPRFVGCYIAILLIDAALPNALLIWGLWLIVLIFTIRDRQDAICRLALLAPLMPGVTLILGVGGAYIGSFPSIACVSIGIWIALKIQNIRPVTRRGFTIEDGFVLLIVLITTILATRFAAPTQLMRISAASLAGVVLPYMILRNYVRDTRDVGLIIASLIAASFPMIVFALFDVKAGWAISDVLRHNSGLAASASGRGGVVRASSMAGSPLIFAFYMVIVVIGTATARSWFAKHWYHLSLVFVILGFILPQSRGAFLAAIPACMVLLITLRRYGSAAALLALAGAGALGLQMMKGGSGYFGQIMAGNNIDGHYDYRGLLLDRGTQEFWKHPFIGVSYESVIAALRDITQGEGIVDMVNSYLYIALVSGGIGLALFVFLYLGVAQRLVARATRGDTLSDTRMARAFLLSTLTATAIYISAMSFVGNVILFFVILIALSRTTAMSLIRLRRGAARGYNPMMEPQPLPA